MKKINKNNIIIIILLILLTLYIKNSSFVIKNILDYTNLFISKLFPANFIFFIISSLLIEYNFIQKISKLLHIDGAIFYVVVMSMISGFPSGSKYIKDLYNKEIISLKTANYLIKFTHFPNPIFILGSVSILFEDKHYATYILIAIILSNLIIGFFLKPKTKDKIVYKQKNNISLAISLQSAITDSIKTIVLIYGTSIFFYLIVTIFNNYIRLDLYMYVLINGFFDLTKGIFLTSLITSDLIKSILIILFISFGSISVNMQVKSIISDTQINYYNFLIFRIFQFIISSIIFLLIIYWSNNF